MMTFDLQISVHLLLCSVCLHWVRELSDFTVGLTYQQLRWVLLVLSVHRQDLQLNQDRLRDESLSRRYDSLEPASLHETSTPPVNLSL